MKTPKVAAELPRPATAGRRAHDTRSAEASTSDGSPFSATLQALLPGPSSETTARPKVARRRTPKPTPPPHPTTLDPALLGVEHVPLLKVPAVPPPTRARSAAPLPPPSPSPREVELRPETERSVPTRKPPESVTPAATPVTPTPSASPWAVMSLSPNPLPPGPTPPPAPLAALSSVERVLLIPDEAQVHAFIGANAARLRVEVEGAQLDVQLHLHKGEADVQVAGTGSAWLAQAVPELRAALEAQGLSLGSFQLGQDAERPPRPPPLAEPLPRVRSAKSLAANVGTSPEDTKTGRLHVKA